MIVQMMPIGIAMASIVCVVSCTVSFIGQGIRGLW